ncbi:MAG TPA: class I SAM-dependent methyltransferase [Bryobacteraceae bacterium]|jgi:SAM-dependent methyltransferase|nr:class I SAM-dependent methyltransferase [Bryobacteraceae bacterium]
MHEILKNLTSDALVLDLGCNEGSFSADATAARVVRTDRDYLRGRNFVQADAAHLPFSDGTFAAIVSNHSLEHFDDLAGAFREIRRIAAPGGALFVAVPDASTLTDEVYRWLARGGGHVNRFTSASETAGAIESATGLHHVATRILYSSLSFLNRRNSPRPAPRRLLLLGGGYEWSLFVYAWLSRRLDRWLKTRTSVYGWAFYFGRVTEPIDTEAWVNVCIRCGSGHAAHVLATRFRAGWNLPGLRAWRCPACGAVNPLH